MVASMKYYVTLLLISLILIASMVFMYSKGKVYGGKLACDNTNMRLNENFTCEKVIRSETRKGYGTVPSRDRIDLRQVFMEVENGV